MAELHHLKTLHMMSTRRSLLFALLAYK
jgi:hypothetical protein